MKKIVVLSAGFLIITGLLFVTYWTVINADQFRPEIDVLEGEVYQMPERSDYQIPEGSTNVAEGSQDKGPREITGEVVKPRLIQKGPKPYPEKAKMLRRSGRVTARLIIHRDGSFKIAQILKETPPDFGFAEAFEEYLNQCGKFEPATLKGKTIPVYYNITLLWNAPSKDNDATESHMPDKGFKDEVKPALKNREAVAIPDSKEFADMPLEISGDIVKPELIQVGPKPYPQKAKMLRRNGRVTARLIVNKDGSFQISDILKETPPEFGFAEAFRTYLDQCGEFRPATRNGEPVKVYYNITLIWNIPAQEAEEVTAELIQKTNNHEEKISTEELKAEAEPLELSGDMVKPYLIRKGRIPCPLKAEMMKRSGKVTGRVIVNKDGRYKFQEIIEETPPNFGFAGAFKAFLEQSDGFKPATLNGKPVSVYYNVTLVWNK